MQGGFVDPAEDGAEDERHGGAADGDQAEQLARLVGVDALSKKRIGR
jgi:hypothetical protein